MPRLVREFVEVADHASLDEVIDALVSLRREMPQSSEAVLRMCGDDVFGRRLSISYLRPQTDAEAALDARYRNAAHAGQAAAESELRLAA